MSSTGQRRVLYRIGVAGSNEWRYRDAETGHIYTAVQARQLLGPIVVLAMTEIQKS